MMNKFRLTLAGILCLVWLQCHTLSVFGQNLDTGQIKHIIIIVKENRSYDHYFGTFHAVCTTGPNLNALCTLPGGSECQGGVCSTITQGKCKTGTNQLLTCPNDGV